MSDARRAARAKVAGWSWSAKPDVVAKRLCEINAKTDERLESEAKAEEAEAEAKAKRQREEAATREKREKEEAIAKAKQEREEDEQEKRDAEKLVIEHAKEIRDGIKNGSIRILSATDLSAQTHKWDGKKIMCE